MPRTSYKQKIVTNLKKIWLDRQAKRLLNFVLHDGSNSGNNDNNDNSTIDAILDLASDAAWRNANNQRYIFFPKYRKGNNLHIFARDLYEDPTGEQLPWLTDEEFREKYRMGRDSFWMLVDLIKAHPVFESNNRKKQAPVPHQVMVFLYYLGCSGSGASNPKMRNSFCLGRGTATLYRNRVAIAIRSLRDKAINWPNEEERKEIAKRVMLKYNLPNCIAVADGTLFPLTYEPQAVDAPDYKGRKYLYSLTVMIVNDDNRRIRYYLAGYPGSVHDYRVYSNSRLARAPWAYFGNKYYLVGDSAFKCSHSVVAAFKAPRGHDLSNDEKKFNTQLSKFRICSEHTIGLLKGRFPWLRSIPMVITDNPRSVKKIVKYIDCCVILHNLLIDADGDIPGSWLEDVDDASDIAAITGDDALVQELNSSQHDNLERRRRLFEYLRDFVL